MTGRAAMLFALAAAAASEGWAQEGGSPRKLTAAPDRRVELDFQHFYTPEQLAAALRALEAAYPELIRLESLGRSASGSELWVASVASGAREDLARRPGVLIAAGLAAEGMFGTELALYALLELAQNHARDGEVAALLSRSAVYVVPCLDPDLRSRALAALEDGGAFQSRAVELDRNFPQAWDAFAPAGSSGPYPLSEPESRALAEFLLARPSIALVQTYGIRAGRAAAGEAPPGDLAAYQAALGRAGMTLHPSLSVRGFAELAPSGGSLAEYAYREQGAFVFELSLAPPAAPPLPDVRELHALGRAACGSTLELAGALARLEVLPPVVQRLKDEQWQIDVSVRNAGALPTQSAAGRERSSVTAPSLLVAGAELIAVALRGRPEESFRVERKGSGMVELPELQGGETVELRLVVASSGAAPLELRVSSPRGASAQASAELK